MIVNEVPMTAAARNIQVPASALGAQADAMLEHLRHGEAVELMSNGRAVALLLPVASAADRAKLEERLGAPALRGLARYASEGDLMGTGEAWDADS